MTYTSADESGPETPSFRQLVKDFLEGVEVDDRTYHFRTYRFCFVARDAIDWLIKKGYAEDRCSAVRVGNMLMMHKVFQHVVSPRPFRDAFLYFRFRPDVHLYTGHGKLLQRFIRGVELKDRWHRFWNYTNCFSGREAVAWILEYGFAMDVAEAVALGNMMLRDGVFTEYRRRIVAFENSARLFRFTKEAHDFIERCKGYRSASFLSSSSGHDLSFGASSAIGGYYSRSASAEATDDDDSKDTSERSDVRTGSVSTTDSTPRHRRVKSDNMVNLRLPLLTRRRSGSESATRHPTKLPTARNSSFDHSMRRVSTSRSLCNLTIQQCVNRSRFCCEMAHVAIGQDDSGRAALQLTRAQVWGGLALSSSSASNVNTPDTNIAPIESAYNTFPKKSMGVDFGMSSDANKLSPQLQSLKQQLADLRESLKTIRAPRASDLENATVHLDPEAIYGGVGGVLSPSELGVLTRGSQVNGMTLLPWMENDRMTDFAQGVATSKDNRCCFEDKFGLLKLSTRQKLRFGGWRRPYEFLEKGVTPQMIQLVSALTIKQDVVGNCSFVSSLCVAAAYERRFKKPILTRTIYPQDRDGRPMYNPFGKYMVRFHYNGVPRKILVDDRLPVDRHGRLLSASSTLRGELWVPILEKAYMKLRGGYDFSGGNSGIDLHAMTGWIPETQQVDLPTFDTERTWKRMLNGHKAGLCLITIGTPEMCEEDELRYGLVSNHAYAVLDVREVLGLRMLKLKNPWSHSRWRGAYSAEDTESWTSQLREELKFDQVYGTLDSPGHDDGVFWIDYISLCRRFSFLFMNWKPRLFPIVRKVHGCWPADAAGPKDDSYNLAFNPQFVLNLEVGARRRPAALWMLLSQHKHTASSTNAADAEKEYSSKSMTSREDSTCKSDDASFLTLHIYSGKQGRVLYPHGALLRTAYTDDPHTLVRFYVPPGSHCFALVLSQWDQRRDIDFTLAVFSMVDCTLKRMPRLIAPRLHLPFIFDSTNLVVSSQDTRAVFVDHDRSTLQWELSLNCDGATTDLVALLEACDNERQCSFSRDEDTSSLVAWYDTSDATLSSRNMSDRKVPKVSKVERGPANAEDDARNQTEVSNCLIRVDLVRISETSFTSRCTLPLDHRTIVASSGSFRPRFCALSAHNLSTTDRYVLVASSISQTAISARESNVAEDKEDSVGEKDGTTHSRRRTNAANIKRTHTRFALRVGSRSGTVRATPIPPAGYGMLRRFFFGRWSFEDGSAAGSHNFGRYHSNPKLIFKIRGSRRSVRFTAKLQVDCRESQKISANVSLFGQNMFDEDDGQDEKKMSIASSALTKRRHNSSPAIGIDCDRKTTHARASLDAESARQMANVSIHDATGEWAKDENSGVRCSPLMRRLREIVDSERDSNFEASASTSSKRGSDGNALVTISYARVRDVLVREFGSETFAEYKDYVQREMQSMSGIVTGKLLATSCDGMYSSRKGGVSLPELSIDSSKTYILIISTFEPTESPFRVTLRFEKGAVVDVIAKRGIA